MHSRYANLLTFKPRRHFQLLLTTHHLVRLHCRRVSALWHSGRCSRSHCSDRLRLPWRQIWKPSLDFHLWTLDKHSGHAVDRLLAASQQYWPLVWILSDPGIAHAVRRSAQSDFKQCSWLHQEDDCSCDVSDWILCWKHHWPSDFPSKGCSKIYPC